MKKSNLKVGDKVRYASEFLRSIGVHTGDMCFAKGEITEIHTLGEGPNKFAHVRWDYDDLPDKIHVLNLERCK